MTPASKRWVGLGAAAVVALATPALAAPSSTDLVPVRSARTQSIAALSAGAGNGAPCLTGVVQTLRAEKQRGTAAQRRALVSLANDAPLPGERQVFDPDGVTVRFTLDRTSVDRLELADDNGNGRPDTVDEALAGAMRAQRLLVGQLELPSPGPVEIILSRLGSGVEGVSVPPAGRPLRVHIWLDPTPRAGLAAVRRAAEHQYAHAVASAAGLDAPWGEAFATWTALALEGGPDERALASLTNRFAAAGAGLVTQDLDLAIGNGAWFAFLYDAYGPTAVKLAVEELGGGDSEQAALDRAMRRATGDSVDIALRDFHLWSVLTGPRNDGKHFAFASRLPGPPIAATATAFPALSVQTDPEVGPMGQAVILLRPDETGGGLTVRFEGDVTARWATDALVVRTTGELRRVPIALDADDSGEISIPLQDVREILLLVRNLDAEGHPARRYSWGADLDPGYPAEFGAVRAEAAGSGTGALVSWETVTERGLLGFNVLRSRSDRPEASRVNPVWIPAVGDAGGPAAYSFFDAGTEPGVPYRYRIEAITLDGLASRSEAAVLAPLP